jgi:type IV pilus assembly protein PilE
MKLQKGFTLIEVMVVVVIVAILASAVYPSYLDHLIKSKRAAAQGFMMSVANKEEQIMLDYRCYVPVAGNADFPKDPAGTPPGLNLTVPANVSSHYDIDVVTSACPIATGTAPFYTITATPTSPAQTKDLKCAKLTLNQTGNKGITGTGSVQTCW